MGAGAPSSVMLFQAPQASHLPDHLEWTAPQAWQTKVVDDFAISAPSPAVASLPCPLPLWGEGKRLRLRRRG